MVLRPFLDLDTLLMGIIEASMAGRKAAYISVA
jgi:hypothetical protein